MVASRRQENRKNPELQRLELKEEALSHSQLDKTELKKAFEVTKAN